MSVAANGRRHIVVTVEWRRSQSDQYMTNDQHQATAFRDEPNHAYLKASLLATIINENNQTKEISLNKP